MAPSHAARGRRSASPACACRSPRWRTGAGRAARRRARSRARSAPRRRRARAPFRPPSRNRRGSGKWWKQFWPYRARTERVGRGPWPARRARGRARGRPRRRWRAPPGRSSTTGATPAPELDAQARAWSRTCGGRCSSAARGHSRNTSAASACARGSAWTTRRSGPSRSSPAVPGAASRRRSTPPRLVRRTISIQSSGRPHSCRACAGATSISSLGGRSVGSSAIAREVGELAPAAARARGWRAGR